MGADLFGSFAESTCAAMVIAAESSDLHQNWGYLMFPLVVSSVGILVSIVTSFFATHISKVSKKEDIEKVLKQQVRSRRNVRGTFFPLLTSVLCKMNRFSSPLS